MALSDDIAPVIFGAGMDHRGEDKVMSRHKVVTVGNQAVGKTSLLLRFVKSTFDANMHYEPTIGVEFFSKTIAFEHHLLRLQIWDTAGQQRFQALVPGFLSDASAALVVYDVTNWQSFADTSKWIEDVRLSSSTASLILVGNKADMTSQRQVSTEEGEQAARHSRATFVEISAKTDHNVQALFKRVADALAEKSDPLYGLEPPPSSAPKLSASGSCCKALTSFAFGFCRKRHQDSDTGTDAALASL